MSPNTICAMIVVGLFGWFGTGYMLALGWHPMVALTMCALVGIVLGVVAAVLDERSGK